MSTTVVKFRDPPQHCGDETIRCWKLLGSPQQLAGTSLRVLLPPVPTMPGRCTGPLVWRPTDDEVLRLCGELPSSGYIVVCEHQIEVD